MDKPNEAQQSSSSPLGSKRPSQMRRSIEATAAARIQQRASSVTVLADDAGRTGAADGGDDRERDGNVGGAGGGEGGAGRQRSLTFSRYDVDGADEDEEGAAGGCCPKKDQLLGVKVACMMLCEVCSAVH